MAFGGRGPFTWSFDPETLAALRIQRAREAVVADDPDLALVEAEEYLELHPGEVDALRIVSRAALQIGDAALAREAIGQVLEQAPGGAEDLVALAVARIECADLSGGLDAARWAARIAPDLALAWYYQGVVLERTGDAGGAALAYQHAFALDPEGYPLPQVIDERAWEAALAQARRSLPARLRRFYARVPLVWEAFPDVGSLLATAPPTSPFVDALAAGDLPPEADPWQVRPDRVRLFRGNLGRPAADADELARRIASALAIEAQEWLGGEDEG